MNKTALFIDGSNVHATSKKLGFDVDYSKLIKHYPNLLRAYYYTAVLDDKETFISIRPLIDYLAYNGYSVVTKPTRTYTDELTGLTRIKGNMDGELIVQAMQLIPYIDHMVLFSGDGDYKCLILAMQQHGIRCDVVSSIETEPSMCADELRRAADVFTDWAELRTKVGRLISERPERRSRFSG